MPPATTIPVIICPECAGLEPGAYVGEKSGSVVNFPQEHYADERGFLVCSRCGVVWRSLMEMPRERLPAGWVSLPPNVERFVGANPGFDVREANDYAFFRNLARRQMQGTRDPRAAVERIYDAEALCTILDLPADVKAAVTHHIRFLSEHADLRDMAAQYRTTIRGESVTVATVALVMERFALGRPYALDAMLDAFTKGGERIISPEEFESAYRACAAWFGSHLWRDGPQDALGNT